MIKQIGSLPVIASAAKQPRGRITRPLGCFVASLDRNKEQGSRGRPPCHTRESGYPAGHDAAALGVGLAEVANGRISASVVASWIPAFAGMTRDRRSRPARRTPFHPAGSAERPAPTRNDGRDVTRPIDSAVLGRRLSRDLQLGQRIAAAREGRGSGRGPGRDRTAILRTSVRWRTA